MIPPRVNLSGNEDKAAGLRAFGLSQLRILQEQMAFQGLEQDIRRINFSDGALIEVKSMFGLDEVNIFVPAVTERVEEVEEVKKVERALIKVLGSRINLWAEQVTVVVCDPETIPSISWPEDVNPKSMDRGTCVLIYIEGGVSPYNWIVSGEGYWFDQEYTFKMLENIPGNVPGRCDPAVGGTQEICEGNGGTWRFSGCRVKLYADNTICGDAQIEVTDVCLQTAGGEVPYDKTLKWFDENPTEMGLGAVIVLCIIDGEAPYVWKVEGKGFWFDAEYTLQEIVTSSKCVKLYAEGSSIVPINIWPFHAGACPPANITVQDDCESEIGGKVGIIGRKNLAWDDEEPIEVCPGGSVDITWTGGTPPFYIKINNNTYFWFCNNIPPGWKLGLYRVGTICTSTDACEESATLTIKDTCGGKISREVKIKQPELTSYIQYTTLQMAVDEWQGLSAINEGGCVGNNYTWTRSGGGSLSTTEGSSTVYTAPSTNSNCEDNATITLSYCGAVVDSITIAINAVTADNVYKVISDCQDTDTLCDPPVETCLAGWFCCWRGLYSCAGIENSCIRESLFDNYDDCHAAALCIPVGITDQRTEQQIEDGCCPEALI